MLLTNILLLDFALLASAVPWSGHHYSHNHESSTEVVASLAIAPAVAAVLIQERSPAKEDDNEQDECSNDGDEDEVFNGQQPIVQAAGGGPAPGPSSTSSSSTPPPSPASGLWNAPAGNKAFYVKPNGEKGYTYQQPYPNSTNTQPATQSPAPGIQVINPGSRPVNIPTAGEGQPVQNVPPAVARPEAATPAAVPNVPAASSAPAAAPSTAAGGNVNLAAGVYKASFTNYGAADSFASGQCNTPSVACGWYSNPGYNAAVSQALFGVGPGAGAGPACGNCYKLVPEGGNTIVVKINNLCPADGNPLCAAPVDVDVNFDLCIDDGAGRAMFGDGPAQLNGTAVQVSCDQWSGSENHTS
ncbi:hypothetical protein N7G274_009113 [Stereocaulon virgatum]|uniref:Expansin-like EG45 domain-containing protein n=1 Tax=Stereocaulon virgatum TaxID=373712 RepID=A0ABR3ZX33_9LECA